MEAMLGSFRANAGYCSKEATLTEFGTKPEENGVKTSLLGFKRKIDAGERVTTIAEEETMFPIYTQYKNGLEAYEHHITGKRVRLDRTMPKVYIRIGDSGSGKTRWLDEQFGLDGWARMPNPTSSWWITRTVANSRVVLIDDVGPAKVPKVEEFLEWTDRYPVEFNTKGSFLWWKPEVIVITSNCMPTEWWPNMMESHKDAVMRRIYQIVAVFKGRPEEVVYQNPECPSANVDLEEAADP